MKSPWSNPPGVSNTPTFSSVTVTGVGSQGAPSLSIGAADTGIWSGAAGAALDVSIGGIARVRFNGSGIGGIAGGISMGATTTSPDVTISRLAAGSGGVTVGRWSVKQGAAVASANDVTLGSDGNRFQISGTTQINRILNTGWQGGSTVILHFQGAVTVTHNAVAGSNFQGIMLAGAASFSATADDQLTLQYDSTAAKWYEIARVVI